MNLQEIAKIEYIPRIHHPASPLATPYIFLVHYQNQEIEWHNMIN